MSEEILEKDSVYKWKVLIIVVVGGFMASLDSNVVQVSLPSIMANFGSNIATTEWILTGYMIAFATLMPLTAWLRDRIGYKILFLGALSLFTLGSLLCGLAPSMPTLIIARVLQALGGGAIGPTAMAMITEVFPREERGKALGFIGFGVTLAPAIGPTLGGFLSNAFGWRSIFLVNIPIGIACIMAGLAIFKTDIPHKDNDKKLDIWGFLFLTSFIVAFLLGISQGGEKGWTSGYILTCWVISVLGFIGFLVVESSVKDKIIDLSLFKLPLFSSGAFVTAIRSVALFGGSFLLPFFIQNVMGYNQLVSGLIMLPSSIVMAALMIVFGAMSDKVPPRYPVLIGIVLLAIFIFFYWNIDTKTAIIWLIIPTVIRSVGMALLNAPVITTVLNAVPTKKAGMASSIVSIILQLSGAIGITVFGTIQSSRAKFHHAVLGEMMKNNNWSFFHTINGEMLNTHSLGYNLADSMKIAGGTIIRKLTIEGTVMSFQDTFVVAGIIILLTIPLAFLMPRKKVYYNHPATSTSPVTGTQTGINTNKSPGLINEPKKVRDIME